ncbi:MAG: hypothetical protein L6Q71_06740, partial [Planctomycetes bacterium]|nr:hypothetical protein [Planctomycetota bacterium]
MAMVPLTSTTGDPVFRTQNGSINSIKRFTRVAADAGTKLNTQERLVSPGDDALSFAVSRRARADIAALKVVSETSQVNIAGLSLAIDGLESIKQQLDTLKQKMVQAQVADAGELDGIQAEIDLALSQIDATAKNTKLGKRSLLDGTSTIKAVRSIAANGTITAFCVNTGFSYGQTSGIQRVRVNKLGTGGPVRVLTDGTQVLSLNVSIHSAHKNRRAFASITAVGANSAAFIELRVSGRLGSATIRLNSSSGNLTNLAGAASTFNKLAAETGVVLTSQGTTATMGFMAVGFGENEFVKVELLNGAGAWAVAGVVATEAAGTSTTRYSVGNDILVNGERLNLGGEFGTTARYLKNGFDIEFDININSLTDTTTINSGRINLIAGQGITGLLGSSGSAGEVLKYGFGNFTTENLGRGAALNTVTTACVASTMFTMLNTSLGNQVIGDKSIADLGTGGRLDLGSGDFLGALKTIDRAIGQVIGEQSRLGSIQGNFIQAINRAETGIGNLQSADSDIVGVDATT